MVAHGAEKAQEDNDEFHGGSFYEMTVRELVCIRVNVSWTVYIVVQDSHQLQ